jgi:hypothetical protein
MDAYRGWAERRNDLAHGYVTKAQGPDYSKEDQPTVTTYSLCPSHARSPKWPHSEPEYNYVASEIAAFATAFEVLDRRIEAAATRVSELKDCRVARHRVQAG